MSKNDLDGIPAGYASGYKVTFTDSNTGENIDIPAVAMFYREIGENDKNGNPEHIQNALEDRVLADFTKDNNEGAEV